MAFRIEVEVQHPVGEIKQAGAVPSSARRHSRRRSKGQQGAEESSNATSSRNGVDASSSSGAGGSSFSVSSSSPPATSLGHPQPTILDRLRAWEAANPETGKTAYVGRHGSASLSNNVAHTFSHAEAAMALHADSFDEGPATVMRRGGGGSAAAQDEDGEWAEDDGTAALGGAGALERGDLVEIESEWSLRRPTLAVCLGMVGAHDYFYGQTGRWFATRAGAGGPRTLFAVKGFMRPGELQPIIDAPPRPDVAVSTTTTTTTTTTPAMAATASAHYDAALQALGSGKGGAGAGPARDVGRKALRRMAAFVNEAESVYQHHAARLDGAAEVLADEANRRYLTLAQMVEALLPRQYYRAKGGVDAKARKGKAKEGADGAAAVEPGAGGFGVDPVLAQVPPAVLFAVHLALKRDDVSFRPWHRPTHRAGYMYEVSSKREARLAARLWEMVRSVASVRSNAAAAAAGKEPAPLSQLDSANVQTLENFAARARKAILRSRTTREWSRHGMLGPLTAQSEDGGEREAQERADWKPRDRAILRFMALWAATGRFAPSSRVHNIGTAILREVGLYPESAILDGSVGWTFLQEAGWVAAWDTASRYRFQLPGVAVNKAGGWTRSLEAAGGSVDAMIKDDVFADHRTRWEGRRVYCIDSLGTEEVDDGVSVEPEPGRPGKYWVRVHVADPASSFGPDSPLAKYAEALGETIYLDGNEEKMLPARVAHRFSLASWKTCLTFSALVDEQGRVSDYNIQPARLGKVVYLTYEDLDAACGIAGPASSPRQRDVVFSVGTPPPADADKPRPTRPVTPAAKLSSDDRASLALLHRLMSARRAVYAARGTPFTLPRGVSISTSFDLADPYIRVAAPAPAVDVVGSSSDDAAGGAPSDVLVATAMVMAGEVAARWAVERGLPLPFRSQPLADEPAIRQLLAGRSARDLLAPSMSPPTVTSPVTATTSTTTTADPSADGQARLFWRLKGPDALGSSPGKGLLTMGVSAYAKVTSPLRRYADLVAHWQIAGQLMRELGVEGAGWWRKGPEPQKQQQQEEGAEPRDLEPQPPQSGPPFTAAALDELLPAVLVRERLSRAQLSRGERDERLLQALVRAWRFGDESKEPPAEQEGKESDAVTTTYRLPDTLHLAVESVWPVRSVARGRLADFFNVRAEMVYGDEMDFWEEDAQAVEDGGKNAEEEEKQRRRLRPLHHDDVRPGDVFEVRLRDVNVYSRLVSVRAVAKTRPPLGDRNASGRAGDAGVGRPPLPAEEPDIIVGKLL